MTAPTTSRREPAAAAAGQIIAGKYRVERTLGAGSMDIVVAARHLQLNQLVAIKLMRLQAADDPKLVERFLREARNAAALRSEHAARVMDVGTLDGGAPFIIMEYLEGLSLHEVRKQRGRMPPVEAAAYIRQACEALAEAHALGIVHRDLKPSNLFVTQRHDGSPLVKILDFGVSKSLTDAGLGALTETGIVVGSPQYVSPEQIHSSRKVDARTDIWSLGVILYQLVSGELPFRATTPSALFVSIPLDQPKPLPRDGGPALVAFEAVILRCLEKDPARRYQRAEELSLALLPFTTERSLLMPHVASSQQGSPRSPAPPAPAPATPPASSQDLSSLSGTVLMPGPAASRPAPMLDTTALMPPSASAHKGPTFSAAAPPPAPASAHNAPTFGPAAPTPAPASAHKAPTFGPAPPMPAPASTHKAPPFGPPPGPAPIQQVPPFRAAAPAPLPRPRRRMSSRAGQASTGKPGFLKRRAPLLAIITGLLLGAALAATLAPRGSPRTAPGEVASSASAAPPTITPEPPPPPTPAPPAASTPAPSATAPPAAGPRAPRPVRRPGK